MPCLARPRACRCVSCPACCMQQWVRCCGCLRVTRWVSLLLQINSLGALQFGCWEQSLGGFLACTTCNPLACMLAHCNPVL